MPDDLIYFSPHKKVRCRFSVMGSRFIATLAPVVDETAARQIIDAVNAEFPDATHNTYAYRIGAGNSLIERAFDDREPTGTAGAPMLQILKGNNIADAVVIATRYFGGTKLGIGGLTRAYRDCARLSLEKAVLINREPLETIQITLNYEDLGAVTRLLESLGGKVLDVDYSDLVTMRVQIPTRESEKLFNGFESACRGRGSYKLITPP